MGRTSTCLALAALAIASLIAPRLHAQIAVPPRQFAPGVLTTIPPAPEAQELFSGPVALAEMPTVLEGLDYEPKLEPKTATALERSKEVIFRRPIWNLEFSFKPMRMIYVDVPQGTARMQRKLVYYLVYRVRNLGNHYKPKATDAEITSLVTSAVPPPKELFEKFKDTTNEVEVFGRPSTELRFFPHFVLSSTEYNKEYLDRVIPAALAPIRAREFPGRPNQKIFDSLSISEVPIPISTDQEDHSVWGVVTWTEVDPRIDYFVVYVQGLTNAYRFEEAAGAYKEGAVPGTGRRILNKTLQLNFWRPGDTIDPHEQEIRFGARNDTDPAERDRIFKHYGTDKPIDYLWVYR